MLLVRASMVSCIDRLKPQAGADTYGKRLYRSKMLNKRGLHARQIEMNSSWAMIIFMISGAAFLLLWSFKLSRSKRKKLSLLDVVLVWPLLLRGERSSREKAFIVFGSVFAFALIALSFLLPR